MIQIILYLFIIFLKLLKGHPDFISNDESWKVGLYKDFNVSCIYYTQNLSSHLILWSRDFKKFDHKLVKSIEKEITCKTNLSFLHCVRSTLYFSPLCEDHYGIYQCYLVPVEFKDNFVQYPHKNIQISFNINFWRNTLIEVELSKDTCVSNNVTIDCKVESDISPSMIMLSQILDNNSTVILKQVQQPVSNDSCKTILDHISLTLTSVVEADSGTYICTILHPYENAFKKRKQFLHVRQCLSTISTTKIPKSNNIWIIPSVTVFIFTFIFLVIYVGRRCKVNSKFLYLYDNKNQDVQYGYNDEIDMQSLSIARKLGEGEFGVVYLGSISVKESAHNVAVKVLKYNSNISEVHDFCQELDIMRTIGVHKNVIQYLGYECSAETFKIVMEYATNGTLLELLRLHRRSKDLSEKILIQFTLDVASGMDYLSSLKFVHRDLAARNVLVNQDWTLKIADFGLTRHVSEYYRQRSQGKVPVRWLAIESLLYKLYTAMSDVWSFGILMWEVFSMGGNPYPDVVNVSCLTAEIKNGKRNQIPEYASDKIFEIMERTWRVRSTERPTFSELFYELSLLKYSASSTPFDA